MQKLIVFTDLDGTLLDHETYDWRAARPAIERLHALGFPLVFNSSKTQAEMLRLGESMDNRHPFICENGSSIALPGNYFRHRANTDWEIVHFGKNYVDILALLSQLRERHSYRFTGFNDLSAQALSQLTRLDEPGAELAKQRRSSEPIHWQDSDEALAHFRKQLAAHDLTLVKGGRFYSVMGPCDKGNGVTWLIDEYKRCEPGTEWHSVGLGDSQNDFPMLQAVDHPVLIHNPHGNPPDTAALGFVITAPEPGPTGWNTTVLNLIDSINQGLHHG